MQGTSFRCESQASAKKEYESFMEARLIGTFGPGSSASFHKESARYLRGTLVMCGAFSRVYNWQMKRSPTHIFA